MATVSDKKRKHDASSSSSIGPSFSIARGNKKIKLPKEGEIETAEMLIASNFANSIHNVLTNVCAKQSTELPLQEFHFDSGGSKLVPVADTNKYISTNPGALSLIRSLVTAENEDQINEALENDFTTVAANLPVGGRGGGCGAGFQIYLKGDLVLTVGGGGGGGYSSGHEKTLERGGGGGASIFIPRDDIFAHVGGGHGLVDAKKGAVETKHDDDHDANLFLKKLQKLRDLLSKANPNEIAVLGGGGGGGGETEILRLRSQGEKTDGGGYGFGFEIGSPRAIKLAKMSPGRPKRTVKAPDRLTVSSFAGGQSYTHDKTAAAESSNTLNLPEHLLKEEWAIKMEEYKGKYSHE